jgi:hypothetical protein
LEQRHKTTLAALFIAKILDSITTQIAVGMMKVHVTPNGARIITVNETNPVFLWLYPMNPLLAHVGTFLLVFGLAFLILGTRALNLWLIKRGKGGGIKSVGTFYDGILIIVTLTVCWAVLMNVLAMIDVITF